MHFDRLSTMLLSLSSFAPIARTILPEHDSTSLSAKKIVEDMFHDLSSNERLLFNALQKTKDVTSNVFELLKLFRANNSCATSVFDERLQALRRKLHTAWQEITREGAPIQLKSTCSRVIQLFPNDCKGFKNHNTLSSTLSYYQTTFTKEKKQFLKKNIST